MKTEFNSRDDWYAALLEIAKSHNNGRAIRDFDGWTFRWDVETPEYAYYGEYPEHKPTNLENK